MRSPTQPEFVDFYLPFGGKLCADNRWVKLAELVPWDLVEERYGGALAGTGMGAPALPGRVAFGAMVIKERLGVTDEETVEQVLENPYLQHFLGFRELLREAPFDASMMVHFRTRFGQADYDAINGEVIRMATGDNASEPPGVEAGVEEGPPNCGKLLIDASCTPADITYPTDLKLLNAAREKLEGIIDELHRPLAGNRAKPRTYRRVARRDFLAVTKLKRPGAKKVRKAIGKQLRYIRRDLRHVGGLVDAGARLAGLSAYDYRCLLVAAEVYRQQLEMWGEKKRRVSDRIVSLGQPWVRPIVRGKASAKTEFGAKISVGVSGGYAALHRMGWDAYNECADLPAQAEAYRAARGRYPESVHADKIYRTRANRAWCKARGIRLSGPPLGRPPADREACAQARAQARADEIARNAVEGKFGNAKRKGTLSRVMAKLRETSVSVVNIAVIVLNLDTRLRELLFWLCDLLRGALVARPASRDRGGHAGWLPRPPSNPAAA